MDHIVTLIRDGKIEEAENQLNAQQGESANSASWHYAQGLLREATGDIEEAIQSFESAIEMDGEHLKAAFRLAYNLDLYGNEERAIHIYESLISNRPAHVNILLNLAVIYEDRGEFSKALMCVDRILMDHPNHSRAELFRRDIESSMDMEYDESHERNREKRDAVLDTPVSDFELSVRSRNCLKKMNINSLGDLLKISESELLAYKNFGETSLNEIKAMLKQKGLHLGQLKEEISAPSRPASNSPAPGGPSNPMNKYLSEIEFSGRSRKCLQRLGLLSLGDLCSKTEAELLSTKNFGQTSLNEVKQKLDELGLSLRKAN